MRRSAPAVQVLITRIDCWRGFVIALVLAALISLTSWLFASSAQQFHPAALVVMIAGTVLASGYAVLTLRTPATSLRWDGQHWYAGPAHLVGTEPWGVDVRIRIDLVNWMLLELRSDQVGFPRTMAWLAVQKVGIETDWHGLRCALFSGKTYPSISKP